jgi:hypothetical protein
VGTRRGRKKKTAGARTPEAKASPAASPSMFEVDGMVPVPAEEEEEEEDEFGEDPTHLPVRLWPVNGDRLLPRMQSMHGDMAGVLKPQRVCMSAGVGTRLQQIIDWFGEDYDGLIGEHISASAHGGNATPAFSYKRRNWKAAAG